MIVARGDVFIQRPIEEIFDFVADSRNEPGWLPGATRVDKTTDGPIAPRFGCMGSGHKVQGYSSAPRPRSKIRDLWMCRRCNRETAFSFTEPWDARGTRSP